jgi:hypothetical protein
LFGGVLAEWRGQGIGGQLWQTALGLAHHQGWESMAIGPIGMDSAAADFLRRKSAISQQSFSLYSVLL